MNIEKIIRDTIDVTYHLSLGTSQNNVPWVCELHFAYDDNLNLYFRSRPSRRHSHDIAANPKVAGNIIDKYDLEDKVMGIYFEGEAKVVVAGEDQNLAAECLKKRLGMTDDIIEEAAQEGGHQFYRINVTNWYVFGSFDGNPAQKYTLPWSHKSA